MKRWIHAATYNSVPKYDFQNGDPVTVYNGKVGYANWDGIYTGQHTNRYNVAIAEIAHDNGKIEDVPLSSIIPSQKKYFYSLTFDDVTSISFIKKMVYNGDSIWCDKVRYARVDSDPSIENIVGAEGHIICLGDNDYKVVVDRYISKHYQVTKDSEWDVHVSMNSDLFREALGIIQSADEVVVNFAGYQRIIKK